MRTVTPYLTHDGGVAPRPCLSPAHNFPCEMVAAVAAANECIVVTDDEKHFPGVKLFNPLPSVQDPEIS